MQSIFLIIFAVLGGISFAVQGPVNSALGKRIGVMQASFFSFLGGSLITLVIVLFHGSGHFGEISHVKIWQVLGGFYGAANVCVSVAAIPVLGTALTLMTILLGQLIMGAVIDEFGLFDTVAITITPLRLAGILVVGVGILLIYYGSRSKNQENRDSRTTLYLLLSFLAGVLGAMQSPTNAALAKTIGSWESSMVAFVVGLLGIAIVLPFACKGKWIPDSADISGIKWWMVIGGAYGVFGIFSCLYTIGGLGTALQVVCCMLGQLAGSLVIDSFGLIQTEKHKANRYRIMGVAAIGIGMIIVSLA